MQIITDSIPLTSPIRYNSQIYNTVKQGVFPYKSHFYRPRGYVKIAVEA